MIQRIAIVAYTIDRMLLLQLGIRLLLSLPLLAERKCGTCAMLLTYTVWRKYFKMSQHH